MNNKHHKGKDKIFNCSYGQLDQALEEMPGLFCGAGVVLKRHLQLV